MDIGLKIVAFHLQEAAIRPLLIEITDARRVSQQSQIACYLQRTVWNVLDREFGRTRKIFLTAQVTYSASWIGPSHTYRSHVVRTIENAKAVEFKPASANSERELNRAVTMRRRLGRSSIRKRRNPPCGKAACSAWMGGRHLGDGVRRQGCAKAVYDALCVLRDVRERAQTAAGPRRPRFGNGISGGLPSGKRHIW